MKRLLFITLISIVLHACMHELEDPNWDIEMIVPLVNTTMTINNMLEDSSLNLSNNSEGFINLVYQEDFLDINLDTLIKIDAIADEQIHTLDSASFDDMVIADTSTIGEAITNIPLGSILLPDGSTNSIPALAGIANGDTINVDASKYFKTMQLYKGVLIMQIFNGYPTAVSDISLTLINSTNQDIIATFFFPLISAGSTVSDSVSIAGKIIDENLFAILNNMDVNASSGPVLIDYSDALITTIRISDIGITEATAIFPEQQLTETFKEHTFDLNGPQIEEIGIKEGTVSINVLSTLPNGKMIYNIPSLKKNGASFTSGDMIIPEATNTNLTSFDFNFEGFVLDLTGEEERVGGDTVNTIYTESYTFIDYTGTLETINHTDSFYSFIDFDLTPEYAKGYMGQDTIEIESQENNLNLFNNINATNIELEEVNIKLKIDNYIGADFQIEFIELKGKNDNTNNEVNLINNEILNINRASLSNNNLPIQKTTSELIIPAEELINILPNKITSAVNIYLNPNGPSFIQDFFYPEYSIEASMSIDIPLSLIAENLTFTDTTEVNLPNSEEYIIENIYLQIDNGLPLEANLKLILLDENNVVLDTLLNDEKINAGQVNAENIVTNSSSTTVSMNYTDFQDVKKMISISNFTTQPSNEFVNIFSHYNLGITLSAKINKTLGE